HLYLPSFPTRRSSDLGHEARTGIVFQRAAADPRAGDFGGKGMFPFRRNCIGAFALIMSLTVAPLAAQKAAGTIVGTVEDASGAVDRKSTRLNSSHVAI